MTNFLAQVNGKCVYSETIPNHKEPKDFFCGKEFSYLRKFKKNNKI